ncbi:MAG: globin [Alphaproteobacteria bacterium]|nr:globin [Alphaproteobacteria bacterium]
MADLTATAHERREQIRARAASIGIDDAYISRLVDAFYDRIRVHPALGPIFEEVIGGDWGAHLARMKSFWASVALNAGAYRGKPVPAHQKLVRVQPGHFGIWLALFRQTLEDTAPTGEAVDYFMERANRIAESLQLAMFGLPGLPVNRP